MANKLVINTGEITIPIERNGVNVGNISFNPESVEFAEAFIKLLESLEEKSRELEDKAKEIELVVEDDEDTEDELQIPKNAKENVELWKDVSTYLRSEIDVLFGENTSNIVFGSDNSLDMFFQFFDGITPFVAQGREGKVEEYLNRAQRRSGKSVLK